MKKFLPLVAVLLVSGCVQFAGIVQSSVVVSSTSNPDFGLKVEYYPSEVKPGKKLILGFQVSAAKDLENFKISITDPCVFESDKELIAGPVSIWKGSVKTFRFRLTAGDVDFDTDCKIRFRIEYESDLYATTDLIVLSDVEYAERSRTGTLAELSPDTYSLPSPVEVGFSFSDDQPFVNGDTVYLNVNYRNTGPGFPEFKELFITFPESAEARCSDWKDGKVNPLPTFLKNRAEPTSCQLTLKSEGPISSGKIVVKGSYKYSMYDYINVKVVAK